VLLELRQPFSQPADPALWSEELAKQNPADLFLQLIDFSKDMHGMPGLDASDLEMYVITEIAEYSLKQLISKRRKGNQPMPDDMVQSVSKEMIIVVAGLHAKGFVHLDLKPENLMICKGKLKLIDVDGCVKIGSTLSASDESISYSPIYCAPEWAHFLVDEDQNQIKIMPGLDVWSVGMTICELVNQEAVLREQFGASRHWVFLEWLSDTTRVSLPKCIKTFDADLYDFVVGCLVCQPSQRRTLAQCLSTPYLRGTGMHAPQLLHTEDRSSRNESHSTKHSHRRRHRTLSRKLVLKSLWPL